MGAAVGGLAKMAGGAIGGLMGNAKMGEQLGGIAGGGLSAFMNASLMRKRLTLGDILIFTEWDRESIWRDVWQMYA